MSLPAGGMQMDSFEKQVGTMLDFQHFEENDRLKTLIADFDKTYENNFLSELITFDELVDGKSDKMINKPPRKADRQISKDLGKE